MSALCQPDCLQQLVESVHFSRASKILQMNEIIKKGVDLKCYFANGISCADSQKIFKKAYGESALLKTATCKKC